MEGTLVLSSEIEAPFSQENRNDIEKAEFLLPVVVEEMLNEKRARVKVLSTNERWFGVTY